MTDAALSFTQVDPSVLSELPQELQDELAALLPSTSRAAANSKHAQAPQVQADMHRPAAARSNLLKIGRSMGNYAIQMEQQQQLGEGTGQGKEQTASPAVDEPAAELWAELQVALHALSTASKVSNSGPASSSDVESGAESQEAELKMNALHNIVMQWVACQVQSNLEDVHFLLRRLADFKSAEFVQQNIRKMIVAVQGEVQTAHGAKLRLQSRICLK